MTLPSMMAFGSLTSGMTFSLSRLWLIVESLALLVVKLVLERNPVANEDGTIMAMKLHRLGRVSFRAVKSKRDYLRHRRSYNWLYLSRLAALKEFAFMKALQEHDFSVPNAVDCNRHCVIMSLVQGYPLVQVKEIQNPDTVFEKILGMVVRLAEHGLIHCDFNEFNIMINEEEEVTMIDFPQMVSVSHQNAQMYFDRDVECIFKFFAKRYNLSFEEEIGPSESSENDIEESIRPCFSSINKAVGTLDKDLAASGFTKKDQQEMEKFIEKEDEEAASGDDEFSETIVEDIDSLQESEQTTEEDEESRQSCEASVPNEQTGDLDGSEEEDVSKLDKRLNKHGRRAVAAAHRGRKTIASRNSYKDKGGRLSHSSKVQKQLTSW